MKANRHLSWIVMWLICRATLLLSKIAIMYWKISGMNKESFYRIHLILEETAEMMEAINNGNKIKAVDGLGDLLYVVMGVAVTYWLPAHEIVKEVCRSNKTKKIRTESNIRLRDKGDQWVPPNFERVLKLGYKRLINVEVKRINNPRKI
jgi:NTP pyrophosphatase (non-canonical NTP hydrolase)